MALKDYSPATRDVQIPGGTFAVRGLNSEDVTLILRDHAEGALRAIEQMSGDARQASALVLTKSPELVATIIAVAAVEEGSVAEKASLVSKLTVGIQIDALDKIFEATLECDGGSKNAVETVVKMLNGLTSLVMSARA